MSKILTVVIPSYNVEEFLEKTVTSFISPEIMEDVEILIVNDGSKDKTKELGQELEANYPGTVYLIDKENGGHGSTINKGLSIANGKYFKVVDGDDWVDTDAFVSYIQKLKTLDVDMVLTPFNEVYIPSMRTVRRATASVETNKIYQLSEVLDNIGDCYQMHSITFKTEIIKEKLQITEHCFYVDQEYILLPINLVNQVIFLEECIYQYRLGDENQSVSVTSKQKNREMHKKVVYRLLETYMNQKDSIDSNKKEFLQKRLCGLIYTQVDIYLSMGNVYEEFLDFWNTVKEKAPDIYRVMPATMAKIFKVSPSLGYKIGAKRMKRKLANQA